MLIVASPCRFRGCPCQSYQTFPYCSLHTEYVFNLCVHRSNITQANGRPVVPTMLGLFAFRSPVDPAVPLASGGSGAPDKGWRVLVFGPDVPGPDPDPARRGARTGPPGLIAEALGERLSTEGFDARYSSGELAPYAIEVTEGDAFGAAEPPEARSRWFLDQAYLRGVTSYANDPAGPNPPEHSGRLWAPDTYPRGPFKVDRGPPRAVYNAEFRVKGGRVYLYATRNIYSGDEIFVDYGREYWRHWPSRGPESPKKSAQDTEKRT